MDFLNEKQLRNKIFGCWEGKNIGGVYGAPFEMYRGLVDAKFYVQDLSKGIPANDDLDLQLIWLNAVEKYGNNVNTDILAEYWTTYQIDNSSEYGVTRSNLKAGIQSPLCGIIGNNYYNSNGAFIRSEIWACLSPGDPENAVRFCYEDAIVDHSKEGVYAAAFCVAVESAAFFENDINKLIEIGESYIPEKCQIHEVIEKVKKFYRNKKTIEEIREMLLTDYPSMFALFNKHPYEKVDNFPEEGIGNDAPVQIGIIVASLLIGQGDFEKTLITAVRCGEDADCTAATAGAILGIINGADGLPKKWREPIGHKISTVCINLRIGLNVPSTTDELTDRVVRLIPVFNSDAFCKISENGLMIYPRNIKPYDMRDLYYRGTYGIEDMKIHELLALAPYKKIYKNCGFMAIVDYKKQPMIKVGEEVSLGLTLINSNLDRAMYPITVKVIADEEVSLLTGKYLRVACLNNYECKNDLEIKFVVNEEKKPFIDIYLDITVDGRPTYQVIKCRYYFS